LAEIQIGVYRAVPLGNVGARIARPVILQNKITSL